ncbi:hypothetical protein DVH24_038229 [Malus domestica]|uniref:Uncharacterized protein n=1 Tax=Malus domestica TaxID=3750 RepID=A0A498KDW9_MALDO|nr:hypothetical protein DVH24_038229 [Malus domestica]
MTSLSPCLVIGRVILLVNMIESISGTTFFRKWEKAPIVRKSRKREWENDGNAIGVGIIRECMPIILENLALYKKRGDWDVSTPE